MKKLALVLCMTLVCISSFAQCVSAAQIYSKSQMIPIFVTLPARGVNFATLGTDANVTVPFFTNSITSPLDGHTYTFQIVGTDPTKRPQSTTVKYLPIMLRVHFPDGTVLDPTKPGCNDTVSVEKRFFNSPLFRHVPLGSNGVDVGDTQIIDGFQRAEFWNLVKGTNYHMLLSPAAAVNVIDVDAPAGSTTQTGACAGQKHNLGMISFGGWDNILRGLINQFAQTDQLPIIAAYNVVETSGGCCIIGYHNAFGRTGGTQTYATGAYTDAGIFSAPGIADIHAWTHEMGEWANDPFINNGTPAWGHVGQVGGCQGNLEVGDPLTGTPFHVWFNGFHYHPQELAFFSWFFRTPSIGTEHLYSFKGTFQSAQGACH